MEGTEERTLLNTILRAFITILGTMAIPGVVMLIQTMYSYLGRGDIFAALPAWAPIVAYLLAGAASAAVFYFLSRRIADAIEAGVLRWRRNLRKTPSLTLLAGGIGLIMGLIVAALFSVVIGLIPVAWVSVPLTIIFYIVFGYLGLSIGVERREDISEYFTNHLFARPAPEDTTEGEARILDTSAIIDGRICDVLATGVMNGTIVIPSTVLVEMHRISDSEDPVRRARGRRGLDMVARMQKELPQKVEIVEADFPNVVDPDEKLVRLAKDLGGRIVTTDLGLQKMAAALDVSVLNVNDLANALKPVCTQGEELLVEITRQGREPDQGVAYLDDGTMVVVSDAADRLYERVAVTVTSVLQTQAGRMVFARPAH